MFTTGNHSPVRIVRCQVVTVLTVLPVLPCSQGPYSSGGRSSLWPTPLLLATPALDSHPQAAVRHRLPGPNPYLHSLHEPSREPLDGGPLSRPPNRAACSARSCTLRRNALYAISQSPRSWIGGRISSATMWPISLGPFRIARSGRPRTDVVESDHPESRQRWNDRRQRSGRSLLAHQ